jgi:hypothetical protein
MKNGQLIESLVGMGESYGVTLSMNSYMVSTYINNGWKEGMERIKQEKERKKKAAAQKRVLHRTNNAPLDLP